MRARIRRLLTSQSLDADLRAVGFVAVYVGLTTGLVVWAAYLYVLVRGIVT